MQGTGSLDAVVAFNALASVGDAGAAQYLAEVARVLKPGAPLVFIDRGELSERAPQRSLENATRNEASGRGGTRAEIGKPLVFIRSSAAHLHSQWFIHSGYNRSDSCSCSLHMHLWRL